jgi:uncharacterized membrane protein YbhN (UPF0104 family)
MELFCGTGRHLKRYIVSSARLLVLVGLLYYAFSRVDIAGACATLEGSHWDLVLVGTVLLALQVPAAAWRWQFVLNRLAVRLPFTVAVRVTFMGLFFNQLLPGMVGSDAARIWLVTRAGSAFKPALNSVLLERMIMLVVLVTLTTFSTPLLSARLDVAYLSLMAVLLLLGGFGATALLMIADRLPPAWRQFRVIQPLTYLAIDARLILLDWQTCTVLLALSLLSYLNIIAAMYFFAIAVDQNLNLWAFVSLMPPVLLVSSLPISIGGWGTREVTSVLLLGLIGIDPTKALVISALFGLTSIVISLPGALFYFHDAWQATGRLSTRT